MVKVSTLVMVFCCIISSNIVKDLGILVDDKLKYNGQSATVTKNTYHSMAVMHKLFQYMDHDTFVNSFESFVHPGLDYVDYLGSTIYTRLKFVEEVYEELHTKLTIVY